MREIGSNIRHEACLGLSASYVLSVEPALSPTIRAEFILEFGSAGGTRP